MKGFAGILIILGILALAAAAAVSYVGFSGFIKTSPNPSPSYQTLSENPKYKDVKEKYSLNEEQLRILSTVDPGDNE